MIVSQGDRYLLITNNLTRLPSEYAELMIGSTIFYIKGTNVPKTTINDVSFY